MLMQIEILVSSGVELKHLNSRWRRENTQEQREGQQPETESRRVTLVWKKQDLQGHRHLP
jgi:hypothetical protein